MKQTLDMRFIRYLNLFEKVTGVRIKNCFSYNSSIVFAVPSAFMSRAIGAGGKNVKRLTYLLGKKVKMLALPENIGEAEKFISELVKPITFRGLEISGNEIIITGNRQSKAALIGRNKTRLEELKKIVEEFFEKALKIA